MNADALVETLLSGEATPDKSKQTQAITNLKQAGMPWKCPRCYGKPGDPSCGKSVHYTLDAAYGGETFAQEPLTPEQKSRIEAALPEIKAGWPQARKKGWYLEDWVNHSIRKVFGLKDTENMEDTEEAEKMIRAYIRGKPVGP